MCENNYYELRLACYSGRIDLPWQLYRIGGDK